MRNVKKFTRAESTKHKVGRVLNKKQNWVDDIERIDFRMFVDKFRQIADLPKQTRRMIRVCNIQTDVRNLGNNVEAAQTLSRAPGTLVATTFEISVNNLLPEKQFNKLNKDICVRS